MYRTEIRCDVIDVISKNYIMMNDCYVSKSTEVKLAPLMDPLSLCGSEALVDGELPG